MKRITWFILGILCFTACNNEIEPRIDPEKGEEPQEQQQIGLFMPNAEEISVYSTATGSECTIDTVWVLVFNGSTKRWVEKIPGSKIQNNGQAAQLLPQLSHKIENGNTVICIANVDPNPDTVTVTPATVNICFKLTRKPYYSGGDFLPMYGEITSWSTSSAGSYTCVMTRAVAKIQVRMGTNPSDVTGNFTAENVTFAIHNYGIEGLVKAPSPIGGTAGISARNTNKFYLVQKANPPADSISACIHEFASATHAGIGTGGGPTIPEDSVRINRQHIILTKGTGTNTRYYRLDFYDPVTKKYLDTKRNYHYIFTIHKVRSEGYLTLAQAQNNAGSNIEYTVAVEDGSQSITSNGQYAIVTSVDTIRLTADVTNVAVATFRFIDSTGVVNPATIQNSITTESGLLPYGATLAINAPTGPNPIQNTDQEIRITTTNNLSHGVILFQLGNIIHRLPIKKP